MSYVGEVISAFGLLSKGWNALLNRWDPARAQAKRLIAAFESYGIARQQIPRLLPAQLKLPNAIFSMPNKLKDQVTPELLDWTASYLVIHRSWLDGVEEMPHLVVNHYKSPAKYRNWFSRRVDAAPDVDRSVCILKPRGQNIGHGGIGPLCLVYEETVDGLDGTAFTRYWLLSDQWSLGHAPCLENLLAVIAVARSLGIWVAGWELPMSMLQKLEEGKKLIPNVKKRLCGRWQPEELVDPLPGHDPEWRQLLWQGAQGYLARDDINRHPSHS